MPSASSLLISRALSLVCGKNIRKISDVDEGVVEGSEDASNLVNPSVYQSVSVTSYAYAEDELTLTDLRAERDVLGGSADGLLWWHLDWQWRTGLGSRNCCLLEFEMDRSG